MSHDRPQAAGGSVCAWGWRTQTPTSTLSRSFRFSSPFPAAHLKMLPTLGPQAQEEKKQAICGEMAWVWELIRIGARNTRPSPQLPDGAGGSWGRGRQPTAGPTRTARGAGAPPSPGFPQSPRARPARASPPKTFLLKGDAAADPLPAGGMEPDFSRCCSTGPGRVT